MGRAEREDRERGGLLAASGRRAGQSTPLLRSGSRAHQNPIESLTFPPPCATYPLSPASPQRPPPPPQQPSSANRGWLAHQSLYPSSSSRSSRTRSNSTSSTSSSNSSSSSRSRSSSANSIPNEYLSESAASLPPTAPRGITLPRTERVRESSVWGMRGAGAGARDVGAGIVGGVERLVGARGGWGGRGDWRKFKGERAFSLELGSLEMRARELTSSSLPSSPLRRLPFLSPASLLPPSPPHLPPIHPPLPPFSSFLLTNSTLASLPTSNRLAFPDAAAHHSSSFAPASSRHSYPTPLPLSAQEGREGGYRRDGSGGREWVDGRELVVVSWEFRGGRGG